MSEKKEKSQTNFGKRAIQRQTKIILALFVILAFAIVQLFNTGRHQNIVYAGATLTPTVPVPADTAVPTATAIPPTNTPVPPTVTPIPPTATATDSPVTSGGGSQPPEPTSTPFPVQEIPELGVGGAVTGLWLIAIIFAIMLIWTGHTVFQTKYRARD